MGGGGRRGGAQVVYALYVAVLVAVLVTALVGAPVVRAVVLTLARPPAVDALRAPGGPLVVATACGVVLAAAETARRGGGSAGVVREVRTAPRAGDPALAPDLTEGR